MRRIVSLSAALAVACVLAGTAALADRLRQAPGPSIEISFTAAARSEAVTGRVYVAFSRTPPNGRQTPIAQTAPTGVPLFSAAVTSLAPGAPGRIGTDAFGHPVESLRNLPAGDYWAQPFVNVYTRFVRADGHTIWLHMDQWEGQDWKTSPGNLYGEPVQIHFDPASTTPIRLTADKVNPPVQVPADTDTVKRIKIQSQILSKWWGQPIYLGAVITLPKDYDAHPAVKYPIIYSQGHFSLGAPGGGGGRGGGAGAQTPPADEPQPRVIWASLQHPSPYYDDSYGVNSANNGPFGDAIMQELLPAIETKFRVIREPWARILTGGSTGGWIALAHQIFYPDFYGGSFALCPDGVDFRYHQIVNIYKDANAYWIPGRSEWVNIERPDTRQPDGNVTSMMKDENWHELVVGDKSRGGGQWDIWEATYGPAGADGYPQPIWDKKTGAIDKTVAEYWKQHYDLRAILETNWATLGPKVAHKINVYVGDADTYFLNMGVHMLNDFLTKADNPKWTGEIVFQPMAPHCWGPRGAELFQKMITQIDKYAPAGADLKSWRY
jgi:hypothetical protein